MKFPPILAMHLPCEEDDRVATSPLPACARTRRACRRGFSRSSNGLDGTINAQELLVLGDDLDQVSPLSSNRMKFSKRSMKLRL